MVKNSGFVKDKIEPNHYILGGGFIPNKKVLQENGQWDDFLPEPELQNKGKFETFNCTSFNTLNPLEILFRRLFSAVNFSDRSLGISANTKPPGNSPHVVAEAIRSEGLVMEDFLPFSDDLETVEEYYSYKGGNEVECAKNSSLWLREYDFKHEWVYNEKHPLEEKQKRLMDALKYSPLGVSVCAWKDDGEFYIKDTFDEDNHWTVIYGYEEGKYWKVFDSYEPFCKKLKWDYDFGCSKMYVLSKRTEPLRTNWFLDLWKRFFSIFK